MRVASGETMLVNLHQKLTGMTIPTMAHKFRITQDGTLRPIVLTLSLDDTAMAVYNFKLSNPVFDKRAATARAACRKRFEGAPRLTFPNRWADVTITPANVRNALLNPPKRRNAISPPRRFRPSGSTTIAGNCANIARFRDRVVAGGGIQAKAVKGYYDCAPEVVRKVGRRSDAAHVWLKAHFGGIVPAALAARPRWDSLAYAIYVRASRRLEAI